MLQEDNITPSRFIFIEIVGRYENILKSFVMV